MNCTRWFLAVAILFCIPSIQAQANMPELSELFVTLTQPGDTVIELEVLAYQGDTSALPEQVQVNVEFNISNFQNLEGVRIRYGTTPGAGNVFDISLEAVQLEGRAYLMVDGLLYRVVAGRAYVRKLAPSASLATPCFLTLGGTSQGGNPTNTLSKSNLQ